MLKKSLFVTSCLVVFGLLGATEVRAEEQVPEVLNSPALRAMPIKQEVELKSGDFVEFNVGGFSSDQLASKFKLKFKLETCEPETMVVDRYGFYDGYLHRYSSYFGYGTHGTIDFAVSDDFPRGINHIGKERIRLMNVSANTLKIKVGLASGIYVKSQESIDYSDIDFNL